MKKLFKIILVAAMIVTGMAVAQRAEAQATQGSTTVSITVRDAFDTSKLAGVTVTLTKVKKVDGKTIVESTFTGVTNEDGTIEFSNLPSGNFIVKFELTGYATATHDGIYVNENARYNLNQSLYPSVG